MLNTIDIISKRVEELEKSLLGIQNNANAHVGAIQELKRLLKELTDGNGVQVSGEERPATNNMPSNID